MQRRFQVDDLIGEYRVTRFLGEGGMGEVYLGMHEKLGRAAAIKLLHATVTDPSFKTRFFNEARLQASLQHPNIATLYDFQEQDGQLLIFMEYVDGESLDELIERRAFSVDETLTVFASLCEAVGYIHRNGVVHRDIKSQNIKLSNDGTVKLLDFGIAKDNASHGLTQTGGIIGTPNYLSPEQLKGEKATPQADVWALGVLLYEMLTGSLPFKGDSLAGLVLQITTGQFTAPENVNPAVPREVANIVTKCLKKEPSARYKNVDELLKAVRSTLDQRQSKSPLAGATLKSTFGFGSASKPELPATAVLGDSPDTVYQQPIVTHSDHKRSPVMFIVASGVAIFVLLIAIVGIGFWAMNGSAPTTNVVGGQKIGNTNSSQTALRGHTQRVRVDLDEGKAQVVQNGQVVGTTPYDFEATTGENVSLTLQREGFQDKTVNVEVSTQKKVFTFSMKQK